MTTRREFLATSATLAAGLATGCATRRAADGVGAPNIVVIMSDDHGYGDLGCHGHPVLKTPHLDRLHNEALRLTRFYTYPVCSPTRASLMTGRYAYRTGVVDTYVGRAMMDPREITVAEALRQAGYATGIFGKWHLGDSYPLRPMDRGFDASLVHKGGGLCQPSDPRVTSYFDPILWRNGEEAHTKGYCTDIITDAAIEFIRAQARQPFFTVITTNAPHVPLDVDDRYAAPYRSAGVPDDDAKTYGMIANLDENVGRFLAELDVLRLRENTIVIFFTDNGPAFNKTGPRFNASLRGGKGTVYEGGVRVPCFVRWPKAFPSPGNISVPTSVVDLMPTLLAAAGVRAPQGAALDGVDLLPALRDGATLPDRTLFTQWHRGDAPVAHRNAAVVTARYKLVDGRELYDLETDPAEANDLAATHPDIVRDLRARYDAWFADVCATRGFDAVPITIGSPRESVTWLTAQDMRGVSGWGPGDVGAWELDAARAGSYSFELNWLPVNPPGAGICELQCGAEVAKATLSPGESNLTLGPIPLPKGPVRLSAVLNTEKGPRRAEWILVRRA